jgi:hypothetical protein
MDLHILGEWEFSALLLGLCQVSHTTGHFLHTKVENDNLKTVIFYTICSTFCFTEKLNISERAESNNPNSIIYFKEFFSNLL